MSKRRPKLKRSQEQKSDSGPKRRRKPEHSWRLNFTEGWIKNVKLEDGPVDWKGGPYKSKDGYSNYFDTGYKGEGSLRLRVGKRSKTFSYVYRPEGSRTVKAYKLGQYPTLKIKPAREKALDLSARVANGESPAMKRDALKAADTFAELVEAYAKEKGYFAAAALKRPVAAWGNLKATTITREHVTLLTHDVKKASPIMANRIFQMVSACYNWGIQTGSLPVDSVNPCWGLKRPTKKENKRTRVLAEAEIRALWKASDTDKLGDLWKLILLTGCRPGEVKRMRRSHIKADVWTIPKENRRKSDEAQVVTLPKAAQDIIALRPGEWIFPKRGDESKHLAAYDKIWDRLIKKLEFDEPAVPNDLRRTCATYLPAVEGIDRRFMRKLILGHTDTAVSAVYDRYLYQAEKKEALKLWADYLARIVSGKTSKVVALK